MSALHIACNVIVIALWVLGNDRRIARVVSTPNVPPISEIVFAGLSIWWLSGEIPARDWLRTVTDTIVLAMCLRVIWHWWRRRRQGKPSRVLGLVRNLGHKLTVVPVPSESR